MSTTEAPHRMTVEDAEQLVRLGSSGSFFRDLDGIAGHIQYSLVRKHGELQHIDEPMPCKNVVFALHQIHWMLTQAQERFYYITGGHLAADVLQKDFRRMLQRFVPRPDPNHIPGMARVIVVNGRADAFRRLEKDFLGILKVAEATMDRPIKHVALCDGQLVRREEPHPPLSRDTDANSVPGELRFRGVWGNSSEARSFERGWKHVTGEDLSAEWQAHQLQYHPTALQRLGKWLSRTRNE